MSDRKSIDPYMRAHVLERDGYRCRFCGSTEGPFHLDHVYPVSKGGETTVNNLVTSCRRCNGKKSNKVGIWPNELDREEKIQEEFLQRFSWIGWLLASIGYTLIFTGEVWSTLWTSQINRHDSLWAGIIVGHIRLILLVTRKGK